MERIFIDECGEQNGVSSDFKLINGEGFSVIVTDGLRIGIVFEENAEHLFLAFMGSGVYCGEHSTFESAVAAIQVAYFG